MTRWITRVAAALALVGAGDLASRVAAQSTQPAASTVAAIDRIVTAPIDVGKVAGASIAVARRGETNVAKITAPPISSSTCRCRPTPASKSDR